MSLGRTDKFPQGKLNGGDAGEIVVGIRIEQGKVILGFGDPITWLGMDPASARQVAEGLLQAADECEDD